MAVIQNTGIIEEKLQDSLALWQGLENAQCTLINHTENATFRIDLTNGAKKIIRVHRSGYNSERAISSELTWAKALRVDAGVRTPVAIAGANGCVIQTAVLGATDSAQFMVLFEYETGREPNENDDLVSSFSDLGRLAAIAHNHVQHWALPSEFERLLWDAQTILKSDGLWGDWRAAPGMCPEYRPIFDQLDALLRERLHKFGQDKQRFGLIHADMRLANLLIDGDKIKLIDFDDCGFGWYLYDFAAAISFIEDSPAIPALKEAWLMGYRSERELSKEDEAEIDTFIMLRRMALTAWIGSHNETPFAQSLAGDFVSRGAILARDYLIEFG